MFARRVVNVPWNTEALAERVCCQVLAGPLGTLGPRPLPSAGNVACQCDDYMLWGAGGCTPIDCDAFPRLDWLRCVSERARSSSRADQWLHWEYHGVSPTWSDVQAELSQLSADCEVLHDRALVCQAKAYQSDWSVEWV